MAKSTDQAFESIRIIGGLLSSKVLQDARRYQLPGQSKEDYAIEPGLTFNEEIGRFWRIAQGRWQEFQQQIERQDISSHKVAQNEWLLPLLNRVLGYDVEPSQRKLIGEREFPITHTAFGGAVPMVLCGADFDLDRGDALFGQEGRKRSPMGLAQEYLNAETDCLWAIVSNGCYLRLLRDNPAMTRPAYIEIDFTKLFEEDNYADFATAWLLLQASRLAPGNQQVDQCWLEQWRDKGQDEGERALDKLRYGVADALRELGTGFVANNNNQALRDKLSSGELSTEEYFQQVLRLVYRFLFLLTAEDRDVALLPQHYNGDDYSAARKLYEQGYSINTLRERARLNRHYDNHGDAWQQLLISFEGFAKGQPMLAQPALGGLFAEDQCSALESAELENRYLYRALFNLSYFEHNHTLSRINYRDMDTEEFGSVYESLLELIPQLNTEGRWQFSFMGDAEDESAASGHSRKLTGSYYTPDSLVQELIKSALEPVIADRLKANPQQPRDAILSITVCDPACGSGHFLLAAARRLASELAGIDAGSDQPTEQHYRHAIRDVVRHCIYGVDLNPMAVELCKTGLWLESIEPGKPLSFLDANIQNGNGLVGVVRPSDIRFGIPEDAYKPTNFDDKKVCSQLRKSAAAHQEGFQQKDLFLDKDLDALQKQSSVSINLTENELLEVEERKEKWSEYIGSSDFNKLKLIENIYTSAFLSRKNVEQFSSIPTSEDFVKANSKAEINPTTIKNISHLSRKYQYFNWHLAFPNIFRSSPDSGFDVILGNPPWDVMQVSDDEFFSVRDPSYLEHSKSKREKIIELKRRESDPIIREYDEKKIEFSYYTHYCRHASRYRYSNKGKINLYALFLETALHAICIDGKVGLIVPSGLASDDNLKAFIAALLEGALESFYEFENVGFFGAGHGHMVRFALLTTSNMKKGTNGGAELAFQLKSVAQLREEERKFSLMPEDIISINPNTSVLPIFQSKYDGNLNSRIYSSFGIFVNDKKDLNPWQVRLIQNFITATNDTGLYKCIEHQKLTVELLCDIEQEYFRLYEAKMIGAFDHRFGDFYGVSREKKPHKLKSVSLGNLQNANYVVSPYNWIDLNICRERLIKKEILSEWHLVWRDVTDSRASMRTVISAIIPKCVVSDTLSIVAIDSPDSNSRAVNSSLLLANLNSLPLDYFARQKVGGLHLRANVMKQLPVLPPDIYSENDINFLVSRVLELVYTAKDLSPFAKDLGYSGNPYPFSLERRHQIKCELDAYYAKLYGLTRVELRYILDPADVMGEDYPSETFRVLKNKELKEFGEYRTQRLVLEAWDKLERGELT